MSRVRFKATRPVYRRGGLVLSSAAWVEIDPEQLADAANVALLADPVVLIEVSRPGDDGPEWMKLSAEERQLGVRILQAYADGAAESEAVAANLPAAAAGDGAGAGETVAGAGAAESEAVAADSSPAPPTAPPEPPPPAPPPPPPPPEEPAASKAAKAPKAPKARKPPNSGGPPAK